MSDRVAAALAAVSREWYGTRPDGTAVRQVSSPRIVKRVLLLLAAGPGDRVLEVGTGSGYSTALLAHIVGTSGSVVSLDVDGELVRRAARLLGEDGAANVRVVEGDGRSGYAAAAPFDALVAWAALEHDVPAAWPAQVRGGGTIVAPFADRRIRKLRVSADGGLTKEAEIEGGFVPLTAEPFRPWEAEPRL